MCKFDYILADKREIKPCDEYTACVSAGRGGVRIEVPDRFVAMAFFTTYIVGSTFGKVPTFYTDWSIYVRGRLIADKTVIGKPSFAEFEQWLAASEPAIEDHLTG